jgi:AcrR family transcriptional regulator
MFAERGRHSVTVREIVTAAGVNQAAINYHFRDKDSLYMEVLSHGVDVAFERYPVDGGCSAQFTPEQRLYALVESTIRRHLSFDKRSWHGRLMLREMEEPSPEFLSLLDRILSQVQPLLAELVGLINPRLDEEQRWLTSHSVLAQCNSLPKYELFLSRSRSSWSELAQEERVEILARHISDFCHAAIGGLA